MGRKNRIRPAGLVGFLTGCLVFIPLMAMLVRGERLPVKTYTVADGALRDHVERIRVDSLGFIWLCSADGLSRFDGYTFTNFTTADGLPDRRVSDFLESKKGEYWLATGGGVVRMDPRGIRGSADDPLFSVVNPPAKRIAARILFEDRDGKIWVGTTNGLFRLRDGPSLERVDLGVRPPEEEFASISSIIQDRSGNIWIGTEGESHEGLIRIGTDGGLERYGPERGLPGSLVASLLEDDQGRIWVGFRTDPNAGLVRLAPPGPAGQLTIERRFSMKDGLPNWVPSLYQSTDGRIWAGTTSTLCSISADDKVSCSGYGADNGLCNYDITSIAEDGNQNIWLATRCGTKKWSRYGFTSYFQSDGLAQSVGAAIFENGLGELLINDGGPNISRFNGKGFSHAKPDFPRDLHEFGWGWNQVVLHDGDGVWWFKTAQGLFKSTGPARFEDLSRTKMIHVPIGGKNPEIFRIYEDSMKDVWVTTWASPRELWRWERSTGQWINHSENAGIPGRSIDVTAFVEDREGNLWIAASSDYDDSMLIRYREGKFRPFTKNDNPLIAGWLRDLYVDDKGVLWIASTTSGLLRLREIENDRPEFVQYTLADGLSSTGTYCVTGDNYGRIYVGTGRGVDRLEAETGRIENFTTSDGLPASYVLVAFRDRYGDVWFGTQNGVARFVPEPVRERTPPKAFISGFRVSGISRPVSIFGEIALPRFDLGSNERQVTIDFFGLGANVGEKLKFEYRLAGGAWIPTVERSINFGSLSAGDYLFEIRTVTADGIAGTPATVPFSIAFPIWQRWWFVILSLIAVFIVVYLVYRVRITRLLEMERVRTRIATDLHDDIGANLSKISLLSELVSMQITNGASESRRMLASIAEASRSSVDSMRDIVWSINPERDSVLEVTRKMREYAEEMCVPRGILVEFEPSDAAVHVRLDMQLRRELFLIFKEAVTNAVRHSGCSTLRIDLSVASSEVSLEITDNGRGFDTDAASSGNGLANMRSRSEKINGGFEINATAGTGTKISVHVPL